MEARSVAASFCPLRREGEKKGIRRVSDGEGEMGSTVFLNSASPNLAPTLSALGGEEGKEGWTACIALGEGSCRSKS
jgi:hypothetical protein